MRADGTAVSSSIAPYTDLKFITSAPIWRHENVIGEPGSTSLWRTAPLWGIGIIARRGIAIPIHVPAMTACATFHSSRPSCGLRPNAA